MERKILPSSTQGIIAAILALLSLASFIAGVTTIRSSWPLVTAIGALFTVVFPSIAVIFLARFAIRKRQEQSILVRIALIIAIILAIITIPVALYLDSLAPPFSWFGDHVVF